MSTTIYYFTGTGNSLTVAKNLAEKLESSDLVPMTKVYQKEDLASTSEKVGFIFPLYYAGVPKIVFDFVKKIDLTNSTYFFTVVTNAGDIDQVPLYQLAELLKEKSKMLNAGFFITMPNNYIIGYDIHPPERQNQFFENAKEKVNEIADFITQNKENIQEEILKSVKSSKLKFNEEFRNTVNESDKYFNVDENCDNCTICENVCPVNNIKIVEGKPQWQHNCQQCLACINYCPEKAIQFGTKTLKTNRYHHPEVTVSNIGNQK